MPTLTLGQLAAEALKAAKIKATSEGRTLSWDEVAAIIDGCNKPKLTPAEQASTKATVEAIYGLYPRKVGKVAALKAIARAAARLKEREPDPVLYLLERTRIYSTSVALWPADDRQYVPHPSTWFNRGSYDDDPKEWTRAVEQKPTPRTYDRI